MDYRTLYEQSKTLSILLVEDFEPLRREMLEVLEDLFKTVIAASDGKEALHVYQHILEDEHREIDLIISDIQMPNMNGIDFSKKIRELNENQPIIILSAHTDSKYLIEFINMGISKFLTKPIQQDELFDILYSESHKIRIEKDKSHIDPLIHLGEGYTWHSLTHILKHNDTTIALTKHELLLLRFFIDKVEHICTSQNMIDYFYTKDIEISENNIRNLVFKLRRKIPEKCIVSIYGLGYKCTLLIEK